MVFVILFASWVVPACAEGITLSSGNHPGIIWDLAGLAGLAWLAGLAGVAELAKRSHIL